MTNSNINHLCSLVQSRATLFLGRNYLGQQRIKHVHGLFGLRATFYDVDDQTLYLVQKKIELRQMIKGKLRALTRYQARPHSQILRVQ
jgi:hypothetical protein